MVDRKGTRVQTPEAAYQGVGLGVSAKVGKLVKEAPQFGRLAKASQGGKTEVSVAQRKFLDDFAADIGKGVEERKNTP